MHCLLPPDTHGPRPTSPQGHPMWIGAMGGGSLHDLLVSNWNVVWQGCSTLYSRDTNVHLQDLRTAPPGVVLPPWLGTRCAQRADCAWGGVGGILGSVLWTLQECDGLKTAPLLPPPGRPEPPQPGPAPWVARGFVGTHAVSVCLCGQDKVADLKLRRQTYFLTELEAASPRSKLDRVGSASGESLFLASSRCRLLRQPFLRAQAGGERSLSSSSYKAADPIG